MFFDRAAVRTFEVKVRLSVKEFQKLRSVAADRNEAMAAVIRALALEAARESTTPAHDTERRAA